MNKLNFNRIHIGLLILGLFLAGCQEEKEYRLEMLENPFEEFSMFPNLNVDEGTIILSYIHTIGDTLDELMISTFDGSEFSSPVKVTEGKDWFVNFADFPAVAKNKDNLIISWLEMSADGVYDYNIKMSISTDMGNSWSEPFLPHKDGKSAEHGFVSIIPYKEGFLAAWLDGRNTKITDENGKEAYGQMTLRSAMILPDGSMDYELEVDDKICDCCQTDMVNTLNGPVLVYRDRAEGEIRDNYYSIFNGKTWSVGKPIHNDVWEIPGCPVNGPAIDAFEENIIAAWYTQSLNKPRVLAAKYDQNKEDFGELVKVADEKVLGRIDVKYISKEEFLVTYMIEGPGNQGLIKGKIFDNNLDLIQELDLGVTSSSRASGFPRTAKTEEGVLVVYTEIGNPNKLVTKIVKI